MKGPNKYEAQTDSSICSNLLGGWVGRERGKSNHVLINPLSFLQIEDTHYFYAFMFSTTDTLIKKKRKYSSYIRKFRGCKPYMTNDILIYSENICALPNKLGSPSSYMILHPIPSEFPYTYMRKILFSFL